MPQIAIIGSGQAGLVAAHGLLRAGCQVELYSDRSPEEWPRDAEGRIAFADSDLDLDALLRDAPAV